MNSILNQRLADWDALDKKRQARRTLLQKQRRDALRATGVTVRGTPYQKLKWKFKST